MLGRGVEDPHSVETDHRRSDGLGVFDMHTVLNKKKTLSRVSGVCIIDEMVGKLNRRIPIEGYEIHMGTSRGKPVMPRAFHLLKQNGEAIDRKDGLCCNGSRVWGSYIHGLFENDMFRQSFLRIHGLGNGGRLQYRAHVGSQFERLADYLEKYIHVEELLKSSAAF
jgi:adenosylcobyric acid synthase